MKYLRILSWCSIIYIVKTKEAKIMATLIARYIMEVYDDGSIRTSKIDIQGTESKEINIVNLREVTGRTGQILMTVQAVTNSYWNYLAKDDGGFILSTQLKQAMKKTADAYGVTIQSVTDKMTRQMGWNMDQFRDALEDYLNMLDFNKEIYNKEETDKLELKKALKNCLTNRAGATEGDIIEKFFENPKIDLTLP